MTHDLVSVLIPTFDRAYVLPRAVESALAQTHGAIEIVIIDDGSNDGTEELVSHRWGSDSRVRYTRQENAGVAAARNRAIKQARGRYVAFLDSDDIWFPWKLELQLLCLKAFPRAGMIWTDMEAVGPGGERLHARHLRQMYSAWRRFRCESLFEESRTLLEVARSMEAEVIEGLGDARVWVGDVFSAMVTGSLVHTSTVVLRRERLDQVGEFDEALRFSGEDYDFHLRTCREGDVAFADLPTIRYQLGMADRLTRPEYHVHMAANFLTTITKVMATDRNRMRVPRSVVRGVFAEAHAWLGEVLLVRGENLEARRHFLRSLLRHPLQPGIWFRLFLAVLPPRAVSGLRGAYRRLRAGS
jgi:glycosyltransferase involved in cell wall biosynthesis